MLSVIQAAKWAAQRLYSSSLPWVYLTMVTINSREVPHAEEELREVEQMACLSVSTLGMTDEKWIQLYRWKRKAI